MLPLAALALISVWQNAGEAEARVAAERVARARAAALVTEGFLSDNIGTLRALALMPPLRDPRDLAETTAALGRLVESQPEWQGMSLFGADGWNIASNTAPPRTINVGDRAYFQQALTAGITLTSPAIIGRVSSNPTVPLAVPVDFASGGRGVLVATVPTDRLASSLQGQIATRTIQVIIFDGEGQTLVHPDPAQMQALTSLRGRPAVEAALAGQTGSRVTRRDDEEMLVAHAPVAVHGWGALVGEPTAHAFAPVRRDLIERLGLLGLVVVLVGGIGWYFSGRLSALYQHLIDARAQAEVARAQAETAHAEAEAGRRRAAFVAEASQELASSLDYEVTLAKVARLTVAVLGDWCTVQIVQDDGTIRRVAVAHADPSKEELVRSLLGRHEPEPDSDHPVPRVLRTGQPEVRNDVPAAFVAAAVPDPEHREVTSALRVGAYICVPLAARGRIIGAISVISADPNRRYTPADLSLAEALAARAALAVDNARLHREVQEAVRTRDEFLTAASHDLKNPLTLVKATSQMLQRRILPTGVNDPERVVAGLQSIEAAATRMTRLIEALLDVARLQMGEPLELERRPTDLAGLVRQAATEVQQATERHEIRVDGDAMVVGSWDPIRLERVVSNLLDNAVKYSPNGGAITVAVTRDGNSGSPAAVLTVRDSGIGIPPDDLPHVFERFHRGGNVVGRIKGTGLGLAGARQIVEQHGGTIAVASQPGEGTTFTVRLPLPER